MKNNVSKISCNWGFTRHAIKNKVILNLIQDLRRLSLQLVNSVRGRSRIKYGMTVLCNNSGFTLIELLVVVLIIGILAAVAVPQYQKAVDKARVSELIPLAKNLKVQQEVFYLANGHYAADCEELGADLPGGTAEDNYLQKGNYYLRFQCNNENTRVSVSLRDAKKVADSSFLVSIEIFFDHYADQDVGETSRGNQGRAFCYSHYEGRGVNVCKVLGKEVWQDGHSFWL